MKMTSDKEIIQKVYAGKIDKKKLVRLGGTVAFVDILQEAIAEARKDQDQKTRQEVFRLARNKQCIKCGTPSGVFRGVFCLDCDKELKKEKEGGSSKGKASVATVKGVRIPPAAMKEAEGGLGKLAKKVDQLTEEQMPKKKKVNENGK